MDLITANLLRRERINLRSKLTQQEKDADRAAKDAKRTKTILLDTKAQLKSVTATLRDAGYPTPEGDAIYDVYE